MSLHAQGAGAASGRGMDRLFRGEAHLDHGETDHHAHRLEVGGPRVAVSGQGDGDAVSDQHRTGRLGERIM